MKRVLMLIAVTCLAIPVARADDATKETDQQILGAWQLEFTAADGVSRSPLVIVGRQFKSYVAWHIDGKEPQPFEKVALKGDTLVGTITPRERPDVTITCEAKLGAQDHCTGTATYKTQTGDTGDWEFTGKRLPLSTFDEVMKWELSVTTSDNQQHKAIVTVVSKEGKYYAWFSGEHHELPARSITVENDRVELKLTAETPEGRQVDVTLRGTVDGDQVQGNAEYRVDNHTGSIPFKAKRTS